MSHEDPRGLAKDATLASVAKRLEPGCIVAVPTSVETAYVQYVDRIKPYGALIRVLPGLFQEPPSDLDRIASQEERFWVFFPMASAIHRGIFEVVGLAAIPEHARTFPLMKNPAALRAWVAETWWLWDGVREWRTDRSDPRLLTASPKETWNEAMLIERVATGWQPADDLSPPRIARG